jgi:hypothetical protein
MQKFWFLYSTLYTGPLPRYETLEAARAAAAKRATMDTPVFILEAIEVTVPVTPVINIDVLA